MCQAIFNVEDSSRMNNIKVNFSGCSDDSILLTRQICDDESHLQNNVKQIVNIIDCQQRINVIGESNSLYDANLKNYCASSSSGSSNYSELNSNLMSNNDNMLFVYGAAGVVSILILLNIILLFR
jgi:hypothetical protein